MDNLEKEFIGLIPAAGYANRISPIPCSKEVFPIGFSSSGNISDSQPRVVSSYLLESMRHAGVNQALIVIRKGKWDIPSYYLNGDAVNMNVAYVVVGETKGAPFTVEKAFAFCKGKNVVFGFPDIIFQPGDALKVMVEKRLSSGADIVLGLFKANKPEKVDMVQLSDTDSVQKIFIKPEKTDLTYTWLLAVWSPAFTKFMQEFISDYEGNHFNDENSDFKENKDEIYIGDIIQEAIEAGLKVETVKFPDGSYIDIGTTEDLKKAIRTYL